MLEYLNTTLICAVWLFAFLKFEVGVIGISWGRDEMRNVVVVFVVVVVEFIVHWRSRCKRLPSLPISPSR